MAIQNNNEMSDAVEKAEIRLAKIRDCMICLIDLVKVYENDCIENQSLDFTDWMNAVGEITALKQLYHRIVNLEGRELRAIGSAYIDSKIGGDA